MKHFKREYDLKCGTKHECSLNRNVHESLNLQESGRHRSLLRRKKAHQKKVLFGKQLMVSGKRPSTRHGGGLLERSWLSYGIEWHFAVMISRTEGDTESFF